MRELPTPSAIQARRYAVAVTLSALLPLSVVPRWTADAQEAERPTITLTPPSIPAGEDVEAVGSAFRPNAVVRLHLDDVAPATQLAEVRADDEGDFVTELGIPADTPPGDHMVLACEVSTAGPCRVVARAELTVLPPATPASTPTPEPEPPMRLVVAVDNHAVTVENEAIQINFGDNDLYPDGENLRAFTSVTRQPANGEVIFDDIDLLLIYVPNSHFTGTDSFGYTTCDAESTVCDSATVTVDVRPAEEYPERVGDETSIGRRTGPTLSGPCGSLLAWGGFENGRIPADRMALVGGGHVLEAAAAEAFLRMRRSAGGEGVTVDITDSYRSYETQVDVRRRKGHLVATATLGTSVHGWGRAVDMVVPDPVRAWLERNADTFGYINPDWAKRPGKSFAPWHYEFVGATGDDCDGQETGAVALIDRRLRVAGLSGAILIALLAVVGLGVGLWRRRSAGA